MVKLKKSKLRLSWLDSETETKYKFVVMCQNSKCGAGNLFEWCFEHSGCQKCGMSLPLGYILPDVDLRERKKKIKAVQVDVPMGPGMCRTPIIFKKSPEEPNLFKALTKPTEPLGEDII